MYFWNMANQKISELTAISTIDNATDVLPIVDTSATTTKKITLTQVKTSLALNNVDNTSDANKPVSTAQQDALNAKVASNAAIVAATKTKITYDSKGLVTAGNVLDAADMPTGINAANIGTGVVSSTEFGYLDGVTSAIQTQLDAKQATLVSATNIKTINSTSLLGAGDISISASPSGVSGAIQFSNGSAFASDASNFFWDNTNKRLGVGTNAPSSRLQIVTDDATNPQAFSNQTSILAGTASQGALISAFSSTNGAFLNSLWPGNAWFKMNYGGTNHNFSVAGTVTAVIDSNTTFGNGTTSLGARLGVRGSGSTSATTSLLVQNSSGLIGLIVTDDGSATSYGKGGQITNAAFGGISLSLNTSGSLNAAFGYASLNFNTTGSSNTAIGFQSGYGNATGSNNTAIGRNSNITVANYSDNTTVGAFADCGGFSGCTILGKSAVATANNQFVVGSVGTNAGAVNSTTDVPATFLWSVRINGTNYKILMTT